MDVAASPVEGLSADTLAKFKLLQQRFVQGLPERWSALSTANTPASRRDALHRLAGGAGSFGFARMSLLAREAESLALAVHSDQLNQTLLALKSEIDAAVAATQY